MGDNSKSCAAEFNQGVGAPLQLDQTFQMVREDGEANHDDNLNDFSAVLGSGTKLMAEANVEMMAGSALREAVGEAADFEAALLRGNTDQFEDIALAVN